MRSILTAAMRHYYLTPVFSPAALAIRLTRFDLPEVVAGLQDYWQQRLRAWADMGVVGFRCLAAAKVPAAFWQTLIAAGRRHQPGMRFMVWSCGCTPTQIAALEGCGFDASFFHPRPGGILKLPGLLKNKRVLCGWRRRLRFPNVLLGRVWRNIL
ncbi:hypothetical protein ACFS07_31095 [Undibacterium arcticum]